MDATTARALPEVDPDPESVLAALNDEDCRQLLAACEGAPRTVNELAEECDVPISSTYRKVDVLSENGLLEEHTRPRKQGKHPSEYVRAAEGVSVRVDAEGEFDLDLL